MDIRIAISLSLVLTAGCVASGSGAPPSTAPPAPSIAEASTAPDAPAHMSAPAWSTLNWSGYMRAGAADEAPEYLSETSDASRPVWASSFVANLSEAPQIVQVTLDWNASAGQIQLMVDAPGEHVVGTDFASAGPLCLRVPAQLLAAGNYQVMAHSKVAVDAHLAVRFEALGANATLADHAPTASATEAAANAPGFFTSGGAGDAPEACPSG